MASWTWPSSGFGQKAEKLYNGLLSGWHVFGIELNYYHVVDIFLAGIVGAASSPFAPLPSSLPSSPIEIQL